MTEVIIGMILGLGADQILKVIAPDLHWAWSFGIIVAVGIAYKIVVNAISPPTGPTVSRSATDLTTGGLIIAIILILLAHLLIGLGALAWVLIPFLVLLLILTRPGILDEAAQSVIIGFTSVALGAGLSFGGGPLIREVVPVGEPPAPTEEPSVPETSAEESGGHVNVQGAILCSQTVSGQIGENEEHHWTFSGSSGDVVTIAMDETDGNLDTYLHLLDPSSAELITDDDGGDDLNSLIANYSLPSSGTYTIIARGYAHRAGSYELTLTCGSSGSDPGTGTATLTVVNNSGSTICELNISPVTDSTWTGESLGSDNILNGSSYTFRGIDPGDYDLRAMDCSDNVLGVAWDVSLTGSYTWTIGSSGGD